MKPKINYFSFIKIPNQKAHCIQILKMCDQLGENFDVTLFCIKGLKKNLKEKFSLKKKIKIKYLIDSRYKFLNFILKFFYTIKFKKHKNDTVFTRDIHFAFLSLFFYRRIFLELHVSLFKNNIVSYYFLKILFQSNKVRKIFISNELYKIYKKNYVKIINYVIAHDASDDHFKNSKKREAINKLSVGYCGHLYPGRGIEIIINLAKIEEKIKFNILGGFSDDLNRIKKNNIFPGNLRFFKHSNYNEVSNFLSKNHILLAPYEKKFGKNIKIDTSKYMSPLKIFEYMSAKKAIVCSNHKVLKEVLISNKNAILCNPDNFKEWLSALRKLKNKKFRDKLAKNAYKSFSLNYTWKNRVDAILNG